MCLPALALSVEVLLDMQTLLLWLHVCSALLFLLRWLNVIAVPGPGSVGHMAAAGGSMGSTGQQTAPKPVGFTPTASATVARPPAAVASAGSYGAAAGGPPMTSGPPGSMMPSAAAGPAGMAAAPGMSMAPGSLMGQGSVGSMVMQGQQQHAAAPPAAPAGPPAHITMATADVSKVPADHKAILASLNNLFNACMPLANTPGEFWVLGVGGLRMMMQLSV